MRILKYTLLTIMVFGIAAPSACAQEKKLYLAHNGGPGSLFEASANEFAERANQKLPDGFRVFAVGASKLGNDTVVLKKIQSGEVAFGLPSTVMSSLSPKFGIFELPFLIRNRDQVRKISDALLEPALQPEVKKHGYRILAVWENGFRQITNNVRPITSPDDLADLNLRVPKGAWRIKAFRTLGTKPVPMAFNKVYDALRTGEVDGQENPLVQINGAKFQEVQRYLTLSDHVYSPAYLITSDKHFQKLPKDVQSVLNSTAEDMRSWIFKRAISLESELIDRLSLKMQTNQIDVKAFRIASRPLYGEFVRTVPGGAKMVLTVAELADVPEAEYSSQ